MGGGKGYSAPAAAPAAPVVPKEETLTEEEAREKKNVARRARAKEGVESTIFSTTTLGGVSSGSTKKKPYGGV